MLSKTTQIHNADLSKRIAQAKGEEAADLVIKDVKVFHLLTGAIQKADIAICSDTIVGIGDNYHGKKIIKANGMFAVPGFIDSHLHIESSLVNPHEFEKLVLPLGTTTAICDPHELANVIGTKAFDYFLQYADNMIMDLRVQLSSCVPASHLETASTRLLAKDMRRYLDHPKVIGLAEMMNFPGVINQDKEILDKLALSDHIDGHCPLLSGKELNAYVAAGIFNDHESTSYEEAMEKLNCGMRLFLREGSIAKDVKNLAPLLDQTNGVAISFCSDDKNPLEIMENGHINENIKIALQNGASLLSVYRASSYSAAVAFQLQDRGLIAPGRKADIIIMPDLEKCDPDMVICSGQVVNKSSFQIHRAINDVGLNTVKLKPVQLDQFQYSDALFKQPVIKIILKKLLTERMDIPIPLDLNERINQDLLKVMVFERHGQTKNIGKAFCHGFGLKSGAIASSVGHDAHNICVLGANDQDMMMAVNRLIQSQGGYVIILDQQIVAELPLEIGGLMSNTNYEDVVDKLKQLKKALYQLGSHHDDIFQQLAFITLSVIPSLKITDQGLIDVDQMSIVD